MDKIVVSWVLSEKENRIKQFSTIDGELEEFWNQDGGLSILDVFWI